MPWPRAGGEGDLSPRVGPQGTKSTEAQITEKHLEQAWGGRTTHTGPTTSGPSCCAGGSFLPIADQLHPRVWSPRQPPNPLPQGPRWVPGPRPVSSPSGGCQNCFSSSGHGASGRLRTCDTHTERRPHPQVTDVLGPSPRASAPARGTQLLRRPVPAVAVWMLRSQEGGDVPFCPEAPGLLLAGHACPQEGTAPQPGRQHPGPRLPSSK